MSDLMLFGVLRMDYDMAMGDELSRRQFYDRAQQAADEIERLIKDNQWAGEELMKAGREIECLQRVVDALQDMVQEKDKTIDRGRQLAERACDDIERLQARCKANADHARLANINRDQSAAALKSARDEIERLQKENDRLHIEFIGRAGQKAMQRIVEQSDDIERLRAALERVLSYARDEIPVTLRHEAREAIKK